MLIVVVIFTIYGFSEPDKLIKKLEAQLQKCHVEYTHSCLSCLHGHTEWIETRDLT
jgi:hypothetical protein